MRKGATSSRIKAAASASASNGGEGVSALGIGAFDVKGWEEDGVAEEERATGLSLQEEDVEPARER
jgi:hypothetical protein